ncbi:MAG: PilZ domain-containing protein [Candidatus Lambdaproteobacteria bacterium]|nr:PilZ domain-containing protein [Candidatus Lambdaproteobacteria bacterium]
MSEHRKHSRVPFLTGCVLVVGRTAHPTHLIDISLKGALIETPRGLRPQQATGMLEVRLAQSDVTIRMRVVPAHHTRERTGLRCMSIDVDSMTHLRRLMELNLGDPGLVERELTALGRP